MSRQDFRAGMLGNMQVTARIAGWITKQGTGSINPESYRAFRFPLLATLQSIQV